MSIEFDPVPNAPLTVFKEPERDVKYTLGIDTATGVGEDYTVMQVLSNIMPFEQVAIFRSNIWSVVDASKMADMLGRYYNNAMCIVEVNYPGNAVQDALIQTYRYPRNYQAEDHLDHDPGVSRRFGFKTTEPSKWLLIREFQEAIKNNLIVLHDWSTVEELGNFVRHQEKDCIQAAPGFNDDCVMSIMLAYHAASLYPQAPKRDKKKRIDRHAEQKAIMRDFMSKIRGRKEEITVA